MKSLNEILSEFSTQLAEGDAKLLAKVSKARDKRDALLQRAGIIDDPSDIIWTVEQQLEEDDTHYRERIREMIFGVHDTELSRELMKAFDDHGSEMHMRWNERYKFERQFADTLRSERCRGLPLPLTDRRYVYLLFIPPVVLYIDQTFRGLLDAIFLGVMLLFYALAMSSIFVAYYVAELHRHDVILQEAIRVVDLSAARSEGEATRRVQLPDIFSLDEKWPDEPH